MASTLVRGKCSEETKCSVVDGPEVGGCGNRRDKARICECYSLHCLRTFVCVPVREQSQRRVYSSRPVVTNRQREVRS